MIKTTALIVLFLCFSGFAYADQKPSSVLVSVDGIQVTTEDVRHYMDERIASGISPDAFATSKGLAQATENILSLRRLGKMAREAGVVSSDQIEWEIALQRERLQYREWVRSIVEKEINNTDWLSAAREEYVANPDKYHRGSDQIRVSHILISNKDRGPSEAKSLAENILKKVRAGENFESLVLEYSEDSTVEQNKGDLGFFSKGRMVPSFDKAAFELSIENPISEVVETSFGYHIIKFVDQREAKKLTFEEARDDIINELKSQAPRSIRNRLAMEARSVSAEEAVVNENVLKAFEKEVLGK